MRGNLLVGEFRRELPFVPARFFTIFDAPGRGFAANTPIIIVNNSLFV